MKYPYVVEMMMLDALQDTLESDGENVRRIDYATAVMHATPEPTLQRAIAAWLEDACQANTDNLLNEIDSRFTTIDPYVEPFDIH